MVGDRTFSGVRPPSIIQGRWKVNRRFAASQALTSTYENRYYPVMLKRLIEVALPLKEVSEQSAREKSIRHGQTLARWSNTQWFGIEAEPQRRGWHGALQGRGTRIGRRGWVSANVATLIEATFMPSP